MATEIIIPKEEEIVLTKEMEEEFSEGKGEE